MIVIRVLWSRLHQCVSVVSLIRGLMPHVRAMIMTQVVLRLLISMVLGPAAGRLLRGEVEAAIAVLL
jgi:hypothetical protein